MSKIRTRDELDCEELKPFCQWEHPPVYSAGNGPISCDGSYCDEAYEAWLKEHAVECEVCGEIVDFDTCEPVFYDYHTMCVCKTCIERANKCER